MGNGAAPHPAETLYRDTVPIRHCRPPRAAPTRLGVRPGQRRQTSIPVQTHDLKGFGCDGLTLAIGAAGCLPAITSGPSAATCPISAAPSHESRAAASSRTRPPRNLGLDINLAGSGSNTLLSVLDRCVTAMGSRLLRRWLHRPLARISRCWRRVHLAIGALCADYAPEPARAALKPIGDMERILTRVALRSARPRDLTRLQLAGGLPPRRRLAGLPRSSGWEELCQQAGDFPGCASCWTGPSSTIRRR